MYLFLKRFMHTFYEPFPIKLIIKISVYVL